MVQIEQFEQWLIEDIQPLDIQVQIVEVDASLLVQHNVMGLSK